MELASVDMLIVPAFKLAMLGGGGCAIIMC